MDAHTGNKFNRNGISADPDDPNRFIVEERLHSKLGKDAEVLAALRDPKLQRLLLDIDKSSDREGQLEAKLRLNRFREFADMCLLKTDLAKKREDGSVEFTG